MATGNYGTKNKTSKQNIVAAMRAESKMIDAGGGVYSNAKNRQKSVAERESDINARTKARREANNAKTYKTGKNAGKTYGQAEKERTARRRASGYTNF